MEITNVKMIKDGTYLINEKVQISGLEFTEEGGVLYDVDYNKGEMGEGDAIKLCEQFINKAVDDAWKKFDSPEINSI